MKNIHVLPTDKYSDLVYSINKYGGYFLSKHYSPMKDMGDSYQNIYITNDEEIKDGDWVLNTHTNDVYFLKGYYGIQPIIKKIILTTDQDLIKDGVQAIDDEFLEWFVNNPSCEEVEVVDDWNSPRIDAYEYKIIIPKEEPKRETLEEAAEKNVVYLETNEYISFMDGAKWQQEQILDFLYSEIIERRDYSASKMCEKAIEFIEQFKKK